MSQSEWLADKIGFKLRNHQACANDIIFYPSLDLLYFAHSKNASSFLKWFFKCAALGTEWSQPSTNPHNNGPGSVRFSEMNYGKREDLLSSDSVVKISILREPVDRLWSAYYSRYIRFSLENYNTHQYHRQWRPIRQNIHEFSDYASTGRVQLWTENVTFEEFVSAVVAIPPQLRDLHYARQTDVYSIDDLGLSVVGRVDKMDVFLAILHDNYNLPRVIGAPSDLNASFRPKEITVSEDSLNKIRLDYAEDFRAYHTAVPSV